MSTTDPRARLDEIKARADAATEGPWVPHDLSDAVFDSENDAGWWWVWQESKLPHYGGVLGPDTHGSIDGSIGEASITDARDGHQEKADATFIAHARTDLPAMAAALTAVLDLLDKVADQDEITTQADGVHVPVYLVRAAITDALSDQP